MLVVFVCLDAAVFIGVFDQQAVAVILAGALLAVSVCRDPLVFFISEDGFYGTGNGVLLLDYASELIIRILKIANTLCVSTGFDSAVFIVCIGEPYCRLHRRPP